MSNWASERLWQRAAPTMMMLDDGQKGDDAVRRRTSLAAWDTAAGRDTPYFSARRACERKKSLKQASQRDKTEWARDLSDKNRVAHTKRVTRTGQSGVDSVCLHGTHRTALMEFRAWRRRVMLCTETVMPLLSFYPDARSDVY